jgi:hypothetical protein
VTQLENLRQNRLLRTPEEINVFESSLDDIRNNPNEHDLKAYHLVLDDQCEQPEVMFGLIHFLESFEAETQIRVFIEVMPQLMIQAPQWAMILHNRILNDSTARQIYQELLHSINEQKQHFLYYLLEDSINNHNRDVIGSRS